LQEVTTRLHGSTPLKPHLHPRLIWRARFDVPRAAHGEHEKRTGQRDANWPDWYAAYLVAEQAGTELPQ
jgi:hypothetical protein